MKRLVMLVLVGLLLPVGAFADGKIICKNEILGERSLKFNFYESIECYYHIKSEQYRCSLYGMHYKTNEDGWENEYRKQFEKVRSEIEAILAEKYAKVAMQVFDEGECKILDENLNDITPRSSNAKAKAEAEAKSEWDVDVASCEYSNSCEKDK